MDNWNVLQWFSVSESVHSDSGATVQQATKPIMFASYRSCNASAGHGSHLESCDHLHQPAQQQDFVRDVLSQPHCADADFGDSGLQWRSAGEACTSSCGQPH